MAQAKKEAPKNGVVKLNRAQRRAGKQPPQNGAGEKKSVTPSSDQVIATDQVFDIDTAIVRVFNTQPRKTFLGIGELSQSILAIGQTSPGEVRRLRGDPKYQFELVDGERRFKACKLAGVKFRAVIKETLFDVEEQFLRSIAANFNKQNHDCVEIALACQRLQNKRGMNQTEIGRAFGKSAGWVSQHMSLLKLHPSVQSMLVPTESELDNERAVDGGSGPGRKGTEVKLSFQLGQLMSAYSHSIQLAAAKKISKDGMNMTKARRYVLNLARASGEPVKAGGRRGPRTQERFDALITMFGRCSDSMGVYLDMTPPELEAMARARQPGIKQKLLTSIDEFEAQLASFKELIKKKL